MARRSVTGQLNMFELLGSMEAPGEVQMVSLMPEPELEEPEAVEEPKALKEPEPEVLREPEPKALQEPESEALQEPEQEAVEEQADAGFDREQVAMCRSYIHHGEKVEIAYINYNKVRITRGNEVPEIKVFENSKEAVDYYVERMQELEEHET